MLFGLKSVKILLVLPKTFLFEEKVTLKAMIIRDSKRDGFVMLFLNNTMQLGVKIPL